MPKKIKANGPIIGDANAWIYQWFGIPAVSPGMISKELDASNGDEIELYVNSLGGSAFDGAEIYTLLKDYPGKITAKVTGVAASAASVMIMGADVIKISPPAQIMIHNAATRTDGDKNDHDRSSALLKSTDEAITNAYSLRTGKTRDELLTLMNNTAWMNAQKAVELGFADEIMFNEGVAEVTNSAVDMLGSDGVLPEAVINKVRNELLKSGGFINQSPVLGDRGAEAIIPLHSSPNLQVRSHAKQPVVAVNANKGGTPRAGDTFEELKNEINSMKGENKPMDLNQLKNEHPDLYNQVVNEGVTNERQRITALNELAAAPGAAEIVKNAIEAGQTVAEASLAIVQASIAKKGEVAAARQQDAQNSGVNDVPVQESTTPEVKKAAEEVQAQTEAEEVIAEMKRLRGGK
ncbi:head maturation protease, ClpP-related [Paenibacillus farraposensis]|uniref:ATP-dependent Clp protease proteolytic subunit n=1 Tax=Paenibacillus farraposensis TaxID=2807095 RepID=A0ABW4DE22_9BACL|nr:head maturation protease, ClpP-related [Paenibacillus farraposensis]MCC3379909.1 Clp protease ClpP [Paenibacillus farraposensis]